MTIDLQPLLLGALVFVRAGAMLLAVPAFAGRLVPPQVRVALAVALAWLAWAYLPAHPVPASASGLLVAAAGEAMAGFLMGLAVRVVFAALEFAGQVIATEAGLAISSGFDPVRGSSSSTVETLLFQAGVVVFFAVGAHHEVLLAFLRSFDFHPVGAGPIAAPSAHLLGRATGGLFVAGLQLAGPVIAVNFVVNLTFALLGRIAPKVNVFMTSFSVRVLAGLGVVFTSAGLTVQLVAGRLETLPEAMLELLAG